MSNPKSNPPARPPVLPITDLAQVLENPEQILTRDHVNLLLATLKDMRLTISNFEIALRIYSSTLPRHASKSSKFDIYAPFRSWLANGPVPFPELVKKARRDNFSQSTFYRNFSRGIEEGVIIKRVIGKEELVAMDGDAKMRELIYFQDNDIALNIFTSLKADAWTKAQDVLAKCISLGNSLDEVREMIAALIAGGLILEGANGDYLMITPLGESEKQSILNGGRSLSEKGLTPLN